MYVRQMGLQLFSSYPPIAAAALPSLRELVADGVLIERELVTAEKLLSRFRDRALAGIDRAELERWDRTGVLSPLAFSEGAWTTWRTTEPYPTAGMLFRDEREFMPWDEISGLSGADRDVLPLYSEWQLLYAPHAIRGGNIEIPNEVLRAGGEALEKWAADSDAIFEQHLELEQHLHAAWYPTIKVLLQIQPRYWPFVHGRGTLLFDPAVDDYVDALDLALKKATAIEIAKALGLDQQQVSDLYVWFARRARRLDPLADDYAVLRQQPRRIQERRRGVALRALDAIDAASMLRRFARDVIGELPNDIDQLDDPVAEPRSVTRSKGDLVDALRGRGLYPHRLHIVVEGDSEVRVIKTLFEAFHRTSWERSGLAITSLRGGDNLEKSRPMLDGFSAYAEDLALLVDDENEAAEVVRRLARDGVVPEPHITLSKPSFEEHNFKAEELLALVAEYGREHGAKLRLTTEQLQSAHAKAAQGRKQRPGLATIMLKLAGQQMHGAVVMSKLQLADAMAERILSEIEDDPGRHLEVAKRRPIVGWVLAFPYRALQS